MAATSTTYPRTRGSRTRGRRATGWCLLAWLALAIVGGPSRAQAPSSTPAPNYWTQRVFFIPYQVKQQAAADKLAKVRLLVSRQGVGEWQNLQEAEPHVQGFTFHAPEDGDYWFAVRTIDKQGKVTPSGTVRAQLRIVVDTKKPTLTLAGALDASGAVVLRYEAQDNHLHTDSLSLEARLDGGDWQTVAVGEPDVNQPDRIVGRIQWKAPSGAKAVEFRGTIADKAGHSSEDKTDVVLDGPSLGLSARDWPAEDRTASLPTPDPVYASQPPPASNAYTANQSWPAQARTQLVGESRGSVDATPPRSTDGNQAAGSAQLQPNGNGVFRPPALVAQRGHANSTKPARPDGDGWTQPINPSQDSPDARMVNSPTFDVDYELEAIGPWGVSKVELWGTPDGGRSWRSFGVDPDNRSPVRVTVPGAGTYGFRILVDGANGVGAMPPRSGEAPELVVTVDLQPPTAELLAAELGRGNQSDHLLIRWTASDTNLEPRPIGLFYSTYPNGPWSTIAAGLENTGHYTWRLERHVPVQFYLRLEARDTAGNLTTFIPPSPVALDRPQPTGRLRNVRPVAGSRL